MVKAVLGQSLENIFFAVGSSRRRGMNVGSCAPWRTRGVCLSAARTSPSACTSQVVSLFFLLKTKINMENVFSVVPHTRWVLLN